MVVEMTTARYPELAVRFLNKGIGGNRITDLKLRWKDDVLYHRPDVLVMMIGINDLHSHLRGAEGGVSPELFAETYDSLLALTRRELACDVTLLSPFYISRDHGGDTFRSRVLELIPRYVDTVRAMAQKHGARFVDLHALFQRHLELREADTFCPEPVHPNHTGHLIIAEAMMDALRG
jgi:lysophospholipase L1-like esterase